MDLYKRIKQRREELGMSQDELAKKLGYKSRSTIAKIEKGENDITQSKIAAFAKALNTTPSYLMGWDLNGEISLRIDKLLTDRGISESEWQSLEKCGITAELMHDFVAGTSAPTSAQLDNLSAILHISIDWLKTGEGSADDGHGYYSDPDVVALAEELRTDPNRRILFDATKDLSKDDIDIVLNLINGLKAKEGKK